MKYKKPFERKFQEIYAGQFYCRVDRKNRIYVPSILENTIVNRNGKDSENLEGILIHPKKSGINCYDHKYYSLNKLKLNHSQIYVSGLDSQRRILIPSDVVKKYPLSKDVSISASKDGTYFTIKNKEKK